MAMALAMECPARESRFSLNIYARIFFNALASLRMFRFPPFARANKDLCLKICDRIDVARLSQVRSVLSAYAQPCRHAGLKHDVHRDGHRAVRSPCNKRLLIHRPIIRGKLRNLNEMYLVWSIGMSGRE